MSDGACMKPPDAIIMDFNDFDMAGKDFWQQPQIKWYFSQIVNIRLEFLKKIRPRIEQFGVLFTGYYGLQKQIFW